MSHTGIISRFGSIFGSALDRLHFGGHDHTALSAIVNAWVLAVPMWIFLGHTYYYWFVPMATAGTIVAATAELTRAFEEDGKHRVVRLILALMLFVAAVILLLQAMAVITLYLQGHFLRVSMPPTNYV